MVCLIYRDNFEEPKVMRAGFDGDAVLPCKDAKSHPAMDSEAFRKSRGTVKDRPANRQADGCARVAPSHYVEDTYFINQEPATRIRNGINR